MSGTRVRTGELAVASFPYPGLRPFGMDEAEIFFGREEHIDDLLTRLQRGRFLGVVGPSGCGKSSLIRAGMIPALQGGLVARAGSSWQIAVMRPGSQPLRNLAEALRGSMGCDTALAGADAFLPTILGRGALGLIEALTEYGFNRENNLLLVVDQFEELFRFNSAASDSEARAFVDLLLTSVQKGSLPIYITITMRSDFLGYCPVFRGLPEALNDSQYLTPRLSREQQRLAIEGPAALFNTIVNPDVVNRILNAMGTDPDQLPLMQHLLMRMWRTERVKVPQLEQRVTLTMTTYREVGGLHDCLSKHAQRIYEQLPSSEQQVAERIFRLLTEVTADARPVRRPRSYGELSAMLAPREGSAERVALRTVVNEFRRAGRNFLMPPEQEELTPETLIDIAHESIIRQWRQLKDWVLDEQKLNQVRRLVKDKTAVWKENGEREDCLLFGLDLAKARDWQRRDPSNLEPDEQRLLQRSTAHELEGVRKEEASKYDQITKRFLYLTIFLVIIIAILMWRTSWLDRKAKLETAQRLALMSIETGTHVAGNAEHEEDVSGAVVWYANALFEMDKNKKALQPEAFEMMKKNVQFRLGAAWRRLPKLEHLLHHARLQAFDINSEQQWAVTGSRENEALLWDLNKAKSLRLTHDAPVNDVRFSHTGKYVLTASGDTDDSSAKGKIRAWAVPSGAEVGKPFEVAYPATNLAFDRNGTRLLVVSNLWVKQRDPTPDIGSIYICDCRDGIPVSPPKELFREQGCIVNWAELSPDGHQLVAAVEDRKNRTGKAIVWRNVEVEKPLIIVDDEAPTAYANFVKNGGAILAYSGKEGDKKLPMTITYAGFVKNGGAILTYSGKEGDKAGAALLWENKAERQPQSPQPLSHEGAIACAALDPLGQTAITCGFDGKTYLWNLIPTPSSKLEQPGLSSAPLFRELRHGGFVYSVSFSPDGRYVCTGCRDRKVRIWDVTTGSLVMTPLNVGGGTVDKVMFLEDGHTVVAWSAEAGIVRIWKLLADDARTLFLKTSGSVKYATFNADSQAVVTVTTSGAGLGSSEVRVWKAETGMAASPPLMHRGLVRFAALSRVGDRLVTVDDKHVARLWALDAKEAARPPMLLSAANAPIAFAAFNPEGDRVVTLTATAQMRQGAIHLWDASTGQFLRAFPRASEDAFTFAAFSPDGRRLVTTNGMQGLQSGEARVWNTDTGELIANLPRDDKETERHSESIFHAAFSPDGKYVVTSSADNSARVWDAQTGDPVRHPRKEGKAVQLKHTADVAQAFFSPESGEYIVTASMDGTAVVWDARTGEQRLTLDHPGAVLSASFSPKGNHVITVSQGGVRLWDVRSTRVQLDGVRPGPLVGVLKPLGEVFHASLRLVEEGRGKLIAIGITPDQSTTDERRVVLKEWTFERDNRPVDQVLKEAQLLAHRKIDDNQRSLVLLPDAEVARNWQQLRQDYHEKVPARSENKFHMQEIDEAEARGLWLAAHWHLERLKTLGLHRDNPQDYLVRRAECYRQIALVPSTPKEHKTKYLYLALNDYNEALKGRVQKPKFLMGRGRIHAELNQFDEALVDYEQGAVENGLKERQFLLGLARTFESMSGLTVRQTLQCFEIQVARNRGELTHLPKAIKVYEKILELDNAAGLPTDFSLAQLRAHHYILIGKPLAMDEYTKHAPPEKKPQLLREQAQAYRQLGNGEQALDLYEMALALLGEQAPQRLQLLEDLTRIPSSRDQWDRVAELYRKAVQSQPEKHTLHRLLAQAYAEQGNLGLARTTLEKAPRDVLCQYDLARVLLQMGDMTTYRKQRNDLLSWYGQTSVPQEAKNVAWLLVLTPDSTPDMSKAVELAQKAVSAKRSANNLNTLGAAYYRAGDYRSAVSTLLEAGERVEGLLFLAMAYARLKEHDKARKVLTAATQQMNAETKLNDPDSSIWSREDRKLLRAEAEKLISLREVLFEGQ